MVLFMGILRDGAVRVLNMGSKDRDFSLELNNLFGI